MTSVLITGGRGQLASALIHHKQACRYQLASYAHHELDITDASALKAVIEKIKPQAIINTAAYTAVDRAEQEKEQALAVNHVGAEQLARLSEHYHIPLIQLSTDYVFNGKKNLPYREEDAAYPLNYYGYSKWLGEESVRKYCEQHIILRVSGVFSEYGHNFCKTMLRLANEGAPLRVVADQITGLTYAGHIAEAIFTILDNPCHWGTFHFCGAPAVSWHQFAEAIVQHKVTPITTAEYPTAAPRPLYSVLDCSKIKSIYGIAQPNWQEGLARISS